jgi:hypothetical protein
MTVSTIKRVARDIGLGLSALVLLGGGSALAAMAFLGADCAADTGFAAGAWLPVFAVVVAAIGLISCVVALFIWSHSTRAANVIAIVVIVCAVITVAMVLVVGDMLGWVHLLHPPSACD